MARRCSLVAGSVGQSVGRYGNGRLGGRAETDGYIMCGLGDLGAGLVLAAVNNGDLHGFGCLGGNIS